MSQSVPALVDHLFRHSSGQVIASLMRRVGAQHLELVEDSVQEAIIKALRQWPYRGVPENPEAWLWRVAYNNALDGLRRDARKHDWEPGFEQFPGSVDEDVLALMLACCHPGVSKEGQVALILKLVAGFSVPEISRAFLTRDATTYQRLRRGRQALADAGVEVVAPDVQQAHERLDALLAALYLLFNEGYALSAGERHISRELCDEAIRLTRLVADWDALGRPDVDALLALMLFQAARMPGRLGLEGEILTLEQQDRRLWDRAMIDAGVEALNRSACGVRLTSYHLQAGIASLHCLSPAYCQTDWPAILDLYDALVELDGSSLIKLNRTVALAMVHGPAAGLRELDQVLDRDVLERYALFHATRGELAARCDERERAIASYRRARLLVQSTPERRLIERRLGELGALPVADS